MKKTASMQAFGVGLGEGAAPSPKKMSEADRPAPKARQQKRENPDRILSFLVREAGLEVLFFTLLFF